MFNRLMKPHTFYKPIVKQNDYNENILTYEPFGTIDAVISYNANTQYATNDINITNCDYVGFVERHDIVKGMQIDNKYQITFVIQNRFGSYLALKEIDAEGVVKNV